MSIWSGSDAGTDESTVEPTVEPVEQMRDHVEVPPATSPVDAPMDIAPPEVVPEAKKKSATIEKVKKKKVIKVNRKEEVESVVTIQQPASQPRFVSVTSEKGDADTDEVAGQPVYQRRFVSVTSEMDDYNQVAGRKIPFARSDALTALTLTEGMLSLHFAARLGLLEEAENLLWQNQEKPATKHIGEMQEEEAEMYLEKPEKPKKKLKYIDEVHKDDDIPFRCTALQVAAFYGQVGMVELLLNERADMNSFGESKQRWSPLHLAGMRGHTAAVEILVRRGADFEAEDCLGQIPLELATVGPGKILATQTSPDKQMSRPHLTALLMQEGHNSVETISNLMMPAIAVNHDGGPSPFWKGELRLSERLQVVTCRRFNPKEKNSMLKYFAKEAFVLDTDLDLPTLDVNLLHVRRVEVALMVLPLSVGIACDRQVLNALALTGNEATLATDTVYAMIAAAWSKMRTRTAAEIMLNAVNVGLLCYVSYGFTHGDTGAITVLYFLIFIHLKMTLEELVQQLETVFASIRSAYSEWNSGIIRPGNVNVPPLLDMDQVTDMGYQILGCWALLKQWNHLYDEPDEAGNLKLHLEKRWMAVFSAMAWFRFCYSLRGETWFGPRILPMASALADTVVFFFVALICICAATHAYYNLQLREDSEHASPLFQALLQITRLGIFGDFDLFDFEGADPYLDLTTHDDVGPNRQVYVEENPRPGKRYEDAHILFYAVGLGITILLMNLLIGVLGSNFELYQDRAPALFNRARAKYLLEIDGRPIFRMMRYLDCKAQELEEDNRWQPAILVRSVWRCLAIPSVFFHFVLLLCGLPFFFILAPFCSWSGLYHTIVRLLKAHFNEDDSERQYIWVFQKEDDSGEELRSLHALVKEKVNGLHAVVDEKVNGLGDTLQGKLSEMEDRLMKRLSER